MLTHLLQSLRIPVVYLHSTLNIGWANQTFLEWTGYDKASVEGQPLDAVLGRVIFAQLAQYLHSGLRGETLSFEEYLSRNHHQVERVMGTVTPELDAAGTVFGLSLILESVHTRPVAQPFLNYAGQMFELTQDPVCLIDPTDQFRFVYVNSAACRHFGLAEQDLLKKTVPDVDPTFSLDKCQFKFESLAENELAILETTHVNTQGKQIPVEVSCSLVELEGKPFSFSVIRDLTARIKAEEAIRQNEKIFRELVENLPAGAVYIKGNEIWFNRAVEQLTGYSGSEINTLQSWFETLYPGRSKEVEALYLTDRANPSRKPIIIPVCRKDGQIKHIEFSGVSLDDQEIWLLYDVTDHLATSQALVDQNQLLQTIFDHLPVMAATFDGSGNFHNANRLIEETIGSRFQGLSINEIIDVVFEDPETRRKALDFATRGSTDWEYFQMKTRNGILLDTEWKISRLPNGLSIGIGRDVTEQYKAFDQQKELEEQMWQAQKLETIGVLAGGIAHDFNNLLTAMLGNVGLALRILPPNSPAVRKMKEVELAIQRAADLTRQLLAYAGKGKYIIEPIDLTALISKMSHLFQTIITKKANFSLNLVADLPPIQADASQIQQVIINLLTNASEALEEKEGEIQLSTGLCTLTRSEIKSLFFQGNLREGEYLYLRVKDSGAGISPENLLRIFDPFFSTKFTGRGLGLAAVLGIVRSHNGGIQVFSQPGHGTEVTLYFPKYEISFETIRSSKTPAFDWRSSGTILVIDDEAEIRMLLKDVLEELGFDVLLAQNGMEGLVMFEQNQDDLRLVFVDYSMPRLGGNEFVAETKKLSRVLPVVLMSGYGEAEMAKNLDASSNVYLLEKPFSVNRLTGFLHKVLKA
ncbi:MAG: PAS domain S-box protein [Acidobacteria bacterium]|nr:PAS domain S-box protein [Acidobacteriota bacterium]